MTADKEKFMQKRLERAIEAECRLCVCGGLLYDLDDDGNLTCGDCFGSTEYKGD